MDWSFLQKINLVFCTGTPKSGTTFLQMILNNHPEVSCPAEHAFTGFSKHLLQLLKAYNTSLENIDKKTANQGAAVFTEEDIEEIIKFIIKLAAYRGSKGREVKWYGINENEIIIYNKFESYIKWFPEAKFIVIVRDPRSVTISSWYHNIRTEPGFLEIRGKSKEHWASQIAKIWLRENTNLINFFQKEPSKVLICRYEDLVLNPFENYKKIFEFLGVKTDKEIIKDIIDKTSFKKFKNGKFFRKGSINEWKEELSSLAIKNIERVCGNLMNFFRYKTVYW